MFALDRLHFFFFFVAYLYKRILCHAINYWGSEILFSNFFSHVLSTALKFALVIEGLVAVPRE